MTTIIERYIIWHTSPASFYQRPQLNPPSQVLSFPLPFSLSMLFDCFSTTKSGKFAAWLHDWELCWFADQKFCYGSECVNACWNYQWKLVMACHCMHDLIWSEIIGVHWQDCQRYSLDFKFFEIIREPLWSDAFGFDWWWISRQTAVEKSPFSIEMVQLCMYHHWNQRHQMQLIYVTHTHTH